MTGTPSQIEWAEQIKRTVNAEFDRVRSAFEETARRQSEQDLMDTRAIIVILQEKRMDVMAKTRRATSFGNGRNSGSRSVR